tara:strand:+ start:4036 stop:4905 length:870 start_codon:yes stop_codon:yes gene_type:complete
MIHSMTGFGRAVSLLPNKKITVEVNSLNSKQLDINVRIPSLYKKKEIEIRSYLSSHLRRGKIDLSIFIENTCNELKFKPNQERVRMYMSSLQEISQSPVAEVDLLRIAMGLPESMSAERDELDDLEWTSVMNLVKEAIANLVDFRVSEGLSLDKDLKSYIEFINECLNQVPHFEQERIDLVKLRITKKLEDVLSSLDFDRNRLEQEMIHFTEKFDISEEKVRLKNHCIYFIDTMGAKSPNGKKLGFICQELGREINTMGSKANHTQIQRLVVQMKDALEKIKEQVLNIL